MRLTILIFLVFCSSLNAQIDLKFLLMFLKKQGGDMINAVGSETECAKQMKLLQSELKNHTDWTLKMLDSTGKLESGLLEGNMAMIGNYDECLKINQHVNDNHIRGQFCMTFISPTSSTLQCVKDNTSVISQAMDFSVDDIFRIVRPKWGVCTIAACSSEQLQKLWNFIENRYQIKFHVTFTNESCASKETKKFTVPDYVAMYMFSVIVLMLLLSTIYDILIFRHNKEQIFNVWMSFSLYTNTKRLFSTTHTDESNLTCLYGIRVILMMWIVLGHSYYTYLYQFSINNADLLKWSQETRSMIIFGAFAGVDSYFVISGCLIVYVTAVVKERGTPVNLLVFYGHRILRLTPAMAAVILISSGPLYYFGSGPFWYNITSELINNCLQTWWMELIFIQNYYNPDSMCFPQGWYLAVDTQLYIISPIVYLSLQKWPKPALACISALIITCITGNILTTIYYNLDKVSLNTLTDYYKYLYIATHLRAGPWLVGTILGHFLFTYRKIQITIKRFYVVTLWIISLVLMLLICYCYVLATQNNFTLQTACLFNGFSRTVWGFSTCWIIFACTHGYGGWINTFLSLPFFRVLSRLTYCIYVTHTLIISIVLYQTRTHQYVSDLYQMHQFWGNYIFTIGISLIWTLIFESPVAVLEHVAKKLEF